MNVRKMLIILLFGFCLSQARGAKIMNLAFDDWVVAVPGLEFGEGKDLTRLKGSVPAAMLPFGAEVLIEIPDTSKGLDAYAVKGPLVQKSWAQIAGIANELKKTPRNQWSQQMLSNSYNFIPIPASLLGKELVIVPQSNAPVKGDRDWRVDRGTAYVVVEKSQMVPALNKYKTDMIARNLGHDNPYYQSYFKRIKDYLASRGIGGLLSYF